jgi:hypothetical protein
MNLGKPRPLVETRGVGVPRIYSIHPRDKITYQIGDKRFEIERQSLIFS